MNILRRFFASLSGYRREVEELEKQRPAEQTKPRPGLPTAYTDLVRGLAGGPAKKKEGGGKS